MEALSRREWFRRLGPAFVEAVARSTGAVSRERVEAVVAFDANRCITTRGPECGACAGLCPPEAQGALTLVREQPRLDPRVCNGCGRCVVACPTSPPALQLVSV